MPIVEISVVPLGLDNPSLSQYVANAIKILEKEKDINYQLTAMGTIIEGNSVEKLLKICKNMHDSAFGSTIKRVLTTIKIDERRDKDTTINNKIKSVKEKLKNFH